MFILKRSPYENTDFWRGRTNSVKMKQIRYGIAVWRWEKRNKNKCQGLLKSSHMQPKCTTQYHRSRASYWLCMAAVQTALDVTAQPNVSLWIKNPIPQNPPCCTYLISLGIEIHPCHPGIASLPEAHQLLWPCPLKHSHTSILCSCKI